MLENIREDIQRREKIDFGMISLLSNKAKVGIIGSGKAALIKAKHFLKHGFNVYMIGTKTIDISHTNLNFQLRPYYTDFILDKHIIIICVDNDKIRKQIIKDLDEYCKIYVDCTDFKNGNAIVTGDISTDGMVIGLNTIYGNPKGSMFILNKIKNSIIDYDNFILYTSNIRNKIKKYNNKKNILDFIFTDDFYFFFMKNKSSMVLKMFFDKEFKI